MTTLQKLQVKQSEIRESINALLGKDERSQDETADMERLTGEAQGLEVELRAALVASPDPQEVVTDTADPETRERLEIRSKTGLADFFAAAAGGREVVGAAREYADACGVSALNRLPMAIFPDGAPGRAPGHHTRPGGRWAGTACCAVRLREVGCRESRDRNAVCPGRPSADP